MLPPIYYAAIGDVCYLNVRARSVDEARREIERKLIEDECEGLLERWRNTGSVVKRLVKGDRLRLVDCYQHQS